MGSALVYAYGCGQPTSGMEHARAEVQRQREFWDHLAAIDRTHESRLTAEMCNDEPSLRDVLGEIQELSDYIWLAVDERRQVYAAARRKVPTPEIDERIKTLSARRRPLYERKYDLRRAWLKSHKVRARELNRERLDAVPKCAGSPLYWGNYNDVRKRHDAAREAGRRIRPHDPLREDGCLTIQIQRTASGLGAAPSELHGEVAAIRIEPIDPRAHDRENTFRGDRRRLCRTTVDMRIDREGNRLRLPLFFDRALPPDCRVKQAQITWRTVGGQMHYQLCLTLSGIEFDSRGDAQMAAGVNTGWRLMTSGALLVATVVDSRGREQRYMLDRRWMDQMDHVERRLAQCDRSFDRVARMSWQKSRVPDSVRSRLDPRRHQHVDLHRVMLEHVDAMPTLWMQWRRAHKRRLQEAQNLRQKLLRRRREHYRLFAIEIAGKHGMVAMGKGKASVKVKRRVDEPELPMAARAQRVRAAVSELERELKHQLVKHGCRLIENEGQITATCHHCGSVTGQDDRSQQRWQCEHCGEYWDQDINAATNLCRLAMSSGPVANGESNGKSKGYGGKNRWEKRRSKKPPRDPVGSED